MYYFFSNANDHKVTKVQLTIGTAFPVKISTTLDSTFGWYEAYEYLNFHGQEIELL